MKSLILILLLIFASSYDRNGAVNYAYTYVFNPNHSCSSYDSCTPCSYWGSEHCNYGSNGGDCANFVSQCLVLGGGHDPLNGGSPCRGYPCGFEEIGAKNLGDCLQLRGWSSTCGYLQPPPAEIQPGDVLIYHSSGCDDYSAHATLVTQAGSNPTITCHSSEMQDADYNYLAGSKPFYQWLHYNG